MLVSKFLSSANLSTKRMYYMAIFSTGNNCEPEITSMKYIGTVNGGHLFAPEGVFFDEVVFEDGKENTNLFISKGEVLTNFFDIDGLISLLEGGKNRLPRPHRFHG